MIRRKDNPVMQFIVGVGSPVAWTTFFLVIIAWFWS
jgi:hypothetical protein